MRAEQVSRANCLLALQIIQFLRSVALNAELVQFNSIPGLNSYNILSYWNNLLAFMAMMMSTFHGSMLQQQPPWSASGCCLLSSDIGHDYFLVQISVALYYALNRVACIEKLPRFFMFYFNFGRDWFFWKSVGSFVEFFSKHERQLQQRFILFVTQHNVLCGACLPIKLVEEP